MTNVKSFRSNIYKRQNLDATINAPSKRVSELWYSHIMRCSVALNTLMWKTYLGEKSGVQIVYDSDGWID